MKYPTRHPRAVRIILTQSEELAELREKNEQLEASVRNLKYQNNRTSLNYGAAVTQMSALLDWCRDNNIKVPREIIQRTNLIKENEL